MEFAMQPHRRKRGKGGRPRNAPGEIRARTIGVCVNAAELDTIRRNADSVGLPVSHWLRNIALSRPVPRPLLPEVNRDTYRALAGAVNNLNQLARLAHAGKTACADAVLHEVMAIVRQVQRELCGAGDDSETG